jgi:signal transduction histidine kinase
LDVLQERVLILTPTGKDALLLASYLDGRPIPNKICTSLTQMTALASEGVGAMVLAEEAFTAGEISVLKSLLDAQPSWSDIPIIVLTSGGEADQSKIRMLNAFGAAGNVSLLARPLHTANLLSVLQVALRSRRRQYEVRDLLLAQKRDQEALKKISEDLARSNAELEHFASIASHDLQEPLRKIHSFIDRLRQRLAEAGEAEKDYFSKIENAAARMGQLIKSLLAYSKVASDQTPREEIELGEVMRDVLGDLEVRIAESGAKVHCGRLPRVIANPFQMRQLFQNFITNAVKYAKKDVLPEVTVDCSEEEDRILLHFRDNGIGFEPKYVDRIFKPFQRLHGQGEYQGAGMGLAICDKIVNAHGGRIHTHSVPGEGTVFSVELPRRMVVRGCKVHAQSRELIRF